MAIQSKRENPHQDNQKAAMATAANNYIRGGHLGFIYY